MKSLDSKSSEVVNDKKGQHTTSENKTRILVADGRPAVRQGLIRLINQKADLSVCVEAGSPKEALDAIEKQQVDLAIVDISMGGASSAQLAEKIRLRCPELPVLILSMGDEVIYAKSASTAEAKEYVANDEATA